MISQNRISFRENLIQKIRIIINYVRYPDNKLGRSYDVKKNIKDVLVFYLIKFVISAIWGLAVFLFIDKMEPAAVDDMSKKMSPLSFVLYVLVFAPVLEEAIFRLSLVFKPIYITISVFFLTYILSSKLVYGIGHLDFNAYVIERLVISVVVASFSYLLAKRYSSYLLKLWDLNFRWIYYASIICFAFLHLDLLELTFDKVLLFPLIKFPQLISGTMTGYIRIKYGFVYSCLYHSLSNIMPVMAVLS